MIQSASERERKIEKWFEDFDRNKIGRIGLEKRIIAYVLRLE